MRICDFISAWFKRTEHICAIKFIVGGVSGNYFIALFEGDGKVVDGIELVDGGTVGLVVFLVDFLVAVAGNTIDVANFVERQAEMFSETACVADTFLMSHVVVHITRTGGLIGVEIAFNEEAHGVVFQHTEITVGIVNAHGVAAVERPVTADVRVVFTVICPLGVFISPSFGPDVLSESLRPWNLFFGIAAAIEHERVVGGSAISGGIGVD